MRTIYKYSFKLTFEVQEIELPISSFVLGVVVQFNDPFLYAEVETQEGWETEKRKFQLFPTGGEMHPCKQYSHVGSFFMPNDLFVGHLFETS